MSADINKHIERTQFTAHQGENILSQVQHVLCIVTSDSLISAGFHPSGEVLIVNRSRYTGADAWNDTFIEYELLNDPLLAATDLIRCIYIATVKNIIIPTELFPGNEIAPSWLSAIYYCEATEKLKVQELDKSHASCCFAYPERIEACFSHYISDISIMPLNYIHFRNSVAVQQLLQCTITDHYAIGTLHHDRMLHWHQTFEYQNAEDIVYRLVAACRSFGIDPVNYPLRCTTTSEVHHALVQKLKDYFPMLQEEKSGIATIQSPEWSETIHLFQQLNSCVS